MSKRASTFVVDFGEVQVPSVLEKELELEIQKIALSALARIDFRGDVRLGRLPPGTYGMIFGDWPPDLFPPTFPQPDMPDIDVRDHTVVMQAVMQNALALTRSLASARKDGRKVPGAEVLQALAKLPNLEQPARRAVDQALQNLHLSRAGDKNLPRGAKASLDEIGKQLDACESIEEISSLLHRLQRSEQYAKIDGLSTGLSIASRIIEDGRSTIYSPDNPFYQGETGSTVMAKGVKDVGKEDAKGALTGAMGGAAAGPKGAAAGAVAGAIAGSAAEALSQLWDSIFG
jgi:hypothetical protein